MQARIIQSSKRNFKCRLLDTEEVIVATAKGSLLKDGELVVGDYVTVKRPAESYLIESLEKRKNELHRFIVREAKKKVFASNCDTLIIVSSVSGPEYKRGIIDRYLIRALDWNISPIVVFNKMDEFEASQFGSDGIEFENQRLLGFGASSFEISAKDTNYRPKFLKNGLSELKEFLKGKTSILVGQSGVGKSQLSKALLQDKFEILVGEMSQSGKGAHTTTWATLYETSAYALIDLPGLRSFSLEDIYKDELMSFFPDIADISAMCKFTNCTHDKDSIGCAFYAKFAQNDRMGKLIFSRLSSYKRILGEISKKNSWEK